MPFCCSKGNSYSPSCTRALNSLNGNRSAIETRRHKYLVIIIEATADHRIVWEYISPYWGEHFKMNMVYRAYRVPYEWVPQLDRPRQTAIEPIDVTTFRVPGAAPGGAETEVAVEGSLPYQSSSALCVLSDTDEAD